MTQTVQVRFQKDVKLRKPYSYGPYNKVRGDKQAARLSEGCCWNCPQCNEPTEIKIFDFPEIVRNDVLIFDMNLLCKPEALQIIEKLGSLRVNEKPVRYELVCGADYRFMTQEIANALYQNRFEYVGFDRKCHKKRQIRLAWDGAYSEQRKIKKAVGMLVKAGYKTKEIMLFMQCNYREVGYEECCLKLDLCKVWGVQVCDCYFDGQVMPNVVPEFWDLREIKRFRRKVRKHNMLVNFGIDPEVTGK